MQFGVFLCKRKEIMKNTVTCIPKETLHKAKTKATIDPPANQMVVRPIVAASVINKSIKTINQNIIRFIFFLLIAPIVYQKKRAMAKTILSHNSLIFSISFHSFFKMSKPDKQSSRTVCVVTQS